MTCESEGEGEGENNARIPDVGDGDEDFEWVLFIGLPNALFDFSFDFSLSFLSMPVEETHIPYHELPIIEMSLRTHVVNPKSFL